NAAWSVFKTNRDQAVSNLRRHQRPSTERNPPRSSRALTLQTSIGCCSIRLSGSPHRTLATRFDFLNYLRGNTVIVRDQSSQSEFE
ncbi:MAG: hypothetical protein AAFP69_13065, partial [Planctomycetota bacterium]